MTERDRVAVFVDEVLTRARIPSRREREDLRHELLTHFEDTARDCGSIDAALTDFGSVEDIAARFGLVYRGQRRLAHGLRIAAGLTVSLLVAFGIELVASRPGAFRGMAGLASLVVLVFVLWREVVGRQLRRPTATARIGRWLAAFLAFATWEYGVHHYAGITLGVLRAAAIGGVLISIAASTAVIMAGADRAFGTPLQRHDL